MTETATAAYTIVVQDIHFFLSQARFDHLIDHLQRCLLLQFLLYAQLGWK